MHLPSGIAPIALDPHLSQVLARYTLPAPFTVAPLRGGRTARSWKVASSHGACVLRQAEPDVPGRLPLPLRQRFLAHLGASLPEVPRLIPNACGETLIEVDSRRYEMLSYIAGETLDEAAGAGKLSAETRAAAARLLARYHRAAALAPIPGPEAPAPGRSLAGRWQHLRVQLAGGAADRLPELSGWRGERLERRMAELQQFWESPEVAGVPWLWAHGDYTPFNLVYRGGMPVGLLDFGAVQWAPAAYDIAVALLAFTEGGDSRGEEGRHTSSGPREAFLATYESERALSPGEREVLPMLERHRRAVAVVWIAEECLAGREELRPRLMQYFGGLEPSVVAQPAP